MNCIHKFVKRIIFLCDVCCILAGAVFGIQMIVQRAELKAIANERKAASEIICTLEEENAGLISDVEAYFQEDKVIRAKIHDAEEDYAILEKDYNMRQYIDATAAALDRENGSTDYLERYFRVEKEELQAIINKSGIADALKPGFTVGKEFGSLLPVGEQVWLRYDNDDNLPIGLVVQNTALDIGYQDLKVGRTLDFDIPGERKKVQYDFGTVSYVLFEDEAFYYYYVELEAFSQETILYVTKKQSIKF